MRWYRFFSGSLCVYFVFGKCWADAKAFLIKREGSFLEASKSSSLDSTENLSIWIDECKINAAVFSETQIFNNGKICAHLINGQAAIDSGNMTSNLDHIEKKFKTKCLVCSKR